MLHVHHMKPHVSTNRQSVCETCLHVSLVLSQTHYDANMPQHTTLIFNGSQQKQIQVCIPVGIYFSLVWKVAAVGLPDP